MDVPQLKGDLSMKNFTKRDHPSNWAARQRAVLRRLFRMTAAVAVCALLISAALAYNPDPFLILTKIVEADGVNVDLTLVEWPIDGAAEDGIPAPEAENTDGEDDGPKGEDWQLLLVNEQNPLPDSFEVKLKKLANGHSVDERCFDDLQAMMDDCRAEGLSPLICSSYRPWDKQQSLYQRKVKQWTAKGYSLENARVQAARIVAVPGTSEHQTGLAVDIVDANNQRLDSSQESTKAQQWLMKNSWKYGFILRYPSDKSELTGIIYEPWHYRYVGKEAAKEIYEQGVCLEEYLSAS